MTACLGLTLVSTLNPNSIAASLEPGPGTPPSSRIAIASCPRPDARSFASDQRSCATNAPALLTSTTPSPLPIVFACLRLSSPVFAHLHNAHVRWNKIRTAQAGASVCLTCDVSQNERLMRANLYATAATAHVERRLCSMSSQEGMCTPP